MKQGRSVPAPLVGVLTITIIATTTLAIPSGHATAAKDKCPEWKQAALDAGWTEDQWPRLDQIIWRESRCKPEVHNKRGRDDSYGLTQLNMKAHKSWVGPMVDGDYTKLFDPTTNLTVAKALFDKAKDMFKCGWQPWVTKKTRSWCRR